MRAFELTIHSVDGERQRRGASGGGGVGWRRESVVERRRQEGWGESGVVRRGRDVRGRGRGGDIRGEESGPGELLRVRGRDVREKSIADGSGGRGVGEGAGDGGEDDMLRGAAVALFDLNSSSISCSSCCDKSKTGKNYNNRPYSEFILQITHTSFGGMVAKLAREHFAAVLQINTQLTSFLTFHLKF